MADGDIKRRAWDDLPESEQKRLYEKYGYTKEIWDSGEKTEAHQAEIDEHDQNRKKPAPQNTQGNTSSNAGIINTVNFLNPLNHTSDYMATTGGAVQYQPAPSTGGTTVSDTSEIQNMAQAQIDATNAINEANLAYAKERDALNQQNFEREMDFELQKFKTQLAENDITRAREDNAVQRRMADLAAAGINPLYAAQMAADSSAGNIAGGTPGIPGATGVNLQAPNLSGYANALVSNWNSERDHIINQQRIELDKEIADRTEKHERTREQLQERQRLTELKIANDKLSLAAMEMNNANFQATNEREFREAMQEAQHLADVALQNYQQEWQSEENRKNREQARKLQEEMLKIQKVNTGNKVADTIINTILQVLKLIMGTR